MDNEFEDAIEKRIIDALALYIDFEIWFMGLEEHYQIGIKGIAKDMVLAMKPRWLPMRLWKRWIKIKPT